MKCTATNLAQLNRTKIRLLEETKPFQHLKSYKFIQKTPLKNF